MVSSEACWINADPNQFDTAIINMIVNARDVMGGEGELTIRVAPVSLIPSNRAHAAIKGDFVSASLTDTGAGIDPDMIKQIFEPFFTTKKVGQGTGLGLSQVFGFAKQSGGEVRVESEVGRGTTFTIYLPRAPLRVRWHRTRSNSKPWTTTTGRACWLSRTMPVWVSSQPSH